jgi:hypothetical protein
VKGAGEQRQLRIAECGLRNEEKPIAEYGMNEALQIGPAIPNPKTAIYNWPGGA